MKKHKFLILGCLLFFGANLLTSCYKESDVLSDLVNVKGSVALIDAFTVSTSTPTQGANVTATVTTRSFDLPIKTINLYAKVGSEDRKIAVTTPVTIQPSTVATVQTITYPVASTAPKGTVIVLSVGVVTSNDLENIFTTTRSLTVR